MTAQTILHDLTARGVRVWAEADNLKLDASRGVLTDDDLTTLHALKSDLLDALNPKPTTHRPAASRHPLFREEIEARKLLADLQAAGCGVTWDGDELRITDLSKIPTALWMRLENADSDFLRAAREMTESVEEASEWVN